MNPPELRYSKEHTWVRANGGDAVVGITEFAQEQLGDVVYVDLPEAGAAIEQLGKFGEIESVKTVSDLFSPVSGQIIEANARLADAPDLVNREPYGEGWMLRVTLADPSDLDRLMTADQYAGMVGESG